MEPRSRNRFAWLLLLVAWLLLAGWQMTEHRRVVEGAKSGVGGREQLAERAGLGVGPAASVAVPTLKNYAEQLFTTYLLPVQVVGFMLLIAMLGVIVLSKKFDQTEGAK